MPALLLLTLLLTGEYPVEPVVDTDPPLRIESAWVREAPPGVDVLAAYAVVCNDDEEANTLATVSSTAFDDVQMHVTIEMDGAVRMERSNSVVIGPNDCVTFAPGGRHFMLMGPHRAFRAGSTVPLTFHFANGTEMELLVPVRRADEMLDTQHDHNGHH